VLEIDRLGEIGGDRQHAIAGDIVQPLDDFGDRAPCPGDLARLTEQRDPDILRGARHGVLHRHLLRVHGKVLHAKTIVEERIRAG
jgi:hypothetical protein